MVSATACSRSNASMSRNCSAAASAGPTRCHLRPPVVVRSTVPAVPATHATDALTAASPRNRTVTPVGDSDHAGVPFPRPAVNPPVVASTIRPTAAIDNLRSDLMPGTYAAARSAATAVRRAGPYGPGPDGSVHDRPAAEVEGGRGHRAGRVRGQEHRRAGHVG